MSAANSKITFIQKQCNNFSKVSPEGMMYGIAQIMTMEQGRLMVLLNQHGYENKEMFVVEQRKASAVIRKAGLDLALIKAGSSLILPFYKGEENSRFFRGLLKLEEPVYFHTIVSYIVDSLDEGFITVFRQGNTMGDVLACFQELKASSDGKNNTASGSEEGSSGDSACDESIIHISDEVAGYTNDEEAGDSTKEITETEIAQSKESFDNSKWNNYQERLTYFLARTCLDQKQVESITTRVRVFAESLLGTDKESILDELYNSMFAIDGIRELSEARAEFEKKDTHENLAKYKAAGHDVMKNLWLCLEQCKEKHIYASDRLFYLSKKYTKAYQLLTEKIIGQDYAVNEFVHSCFDAELYRDDPYHPQGVFLFAGPPGVGKTFLAKSVAELLGRPFKIFDMASYAVEKSDLVLIGIEPGFKHAHEGTLVGFVEDNPDAIILFDEIEKAHPEVTRMFLSVLEGARLENKLLSTNTDFSKTVLIFTTNAGRDIYENNKKNLSATPIDVIIKELRKERSADDGQPKFPPELCSRFASQHIVMFNHLGISDMTRLVVRHMDEACKGIEEKLQISVEYDKRLALLLLMHFGDIDVRVVTGKAQQFIRSEVYELSRHLAKMKDTNEIKRIIFSIDDKRVSEKAKAFFSGVDFEETLVAAVCDEATRKKLESIQNDRIKFIFIESEERLMECDPDEVTVFMVDPYYAMYKSDNSILGLEDYDSVGLRIIKTLLKKHISAPVYMLESGRKVSQADKNSLYMRGVEDTVCIDDHDPSEVVNNIVAEHLLQKKCNAMIDRRKVFDFDSLQEKPDEEGTVKIKFYDIVIKDAVVPEDQDLLINIEERPNVKFNDVIGADNAKAELKDFIKYLENPKNYMKYALAVPKGLLLYGPPGTGKTMLAKAMAGETDATFISVSAARLRSKGAESIERLFTTARKYAPAIIFIDEVDAIAHKRTGNAALAYDESLLNLLLTQMDGFEQHDDAPVFVVAATNYSVNASDVSMWGGLDPAFLRRFGNKTLVDQPNKEEKMQFLEKRLKVNGVSILNNRVTKEGMKNIAERTPGESLANLENILELSFRNAARRGKQLDDELLDEAMEEYYYGEKRTIDEKQAYRTAVHEASHAYIYSLSGKKPAYLTVISRGDFGGYMQREDEEKKSTVSKEEFLWSIRTSLAGRVGEIVVFGDDAALNTGASADLRQASSIALNMLVTYGMQEGHLFSISREDLFQSDLMPAYVERAEEILRQEEKACFDLVKKGKDKIVAVAKALLEKSHLNREEIEKLLAE